MNPLFVFFLLILTVGQPVLAAEPTGSPEGFPAFMARPIALNADEKAWLSDDHRVRVLIGHWPPYSYWDGEACGIAVDYLRLIADKFAFKVEFQPTELSWCEALNRLARFEGPDLMLAMTNTPERRRNFLFTRDYLYGVHALITRDDRNYFTRLEDLAGRRVAVVDGYTVQQQLARRYPELKLLTFADDLEKLQAVATGKADACVSVIAVATYMMQRFGLTNLKVAGPVPFPENRDAMAVRRDWPALVSLIDKGLAAMRPQEHNQIRRKNFTIRFEYGVSKREVGLWVGGLLTAASLMILVFCLANRRLKLEISRRYQVEAELRRALEEVNTLRGYIPICSCCHKIRGDDGDWQRLEKYIQENSEVNFSHGLCPDCSRRFVDGCHF